MGEGKQGKEERVEKRQDSLTSLSLSILLPTPLLNGRSTDNVPKAEARRVVASGPLVMLVMVPAARVDVPREAGRQERS